MSSSLWAQTFVSGKPTLTEANLPDQTGKVIIVTGGNNGVGYELTKILYSKNAKVYIASRSQEKAEAAIKTIKSAAPNSTGSLHFLHLDLADLTTIKASAASFAAQESKLDILFNNAGVASPPPNSYSKQGHELQLGTNCLGPYLFTRLVLPQLREAAKTAPQNSVRIVWTSSQLVDGVAPKGGIVPNELRKPKMSAVTYMYSQSKVGNWFLAVRFARELEGENIISITQNPGNLKSGIWKDVPKLTYYLSVWLLHEPIMGAYTNLWAGCSTAVTKKDAGRYAVPWGKWHPNPRQDILKAMAPKEEGGTGQMEAFNAWCDEETEKYL